MSDYLTPMPEFFQSDDLGPAYEIVFLWPRPPLTLNDRPSSWHSRAAITKRMRNEAGFRAIAARLPQLPRIRVSLTWWVKDHRKRDGGENLAPTLKALIDGLVDAGVVPDDDQGHVTRGPSVIHYEKDCTPRIVLRVEPVAPGSEEAVA